MDLPALTLPPFEYQFKMENDKRYIFDSFRKKWIFLSPEEWVRQHIAHFLVNHRQFSSALMSMETSIKSASTPQRADIIAHNRNGQPVLIVECKAPSVKLNQQVFDQAAAYCLHLQIAFFILTNGLEHIACRMDTENKALQFLTEIPTFEEVAH